MTKNKSGKFALIIGIVCISIIVIISILLFSNSKKIVENKTDIVVDKLKSNYSKIKFSEMYETNNGVKDISKVYKSFDGKNIEISGYMAAQSPLDSSYIYLVNQPYVSCPFCTIGDITKLEVIPVYMANKSKINFKENGVIVQGKLEIGEKVDSMTYTTQCRIIADKITDIASENVDTELQSYYVGLAQSGMIIDLQTLQMDIEYATNPEYMQNYGNTKSEIVDGIINEYATIKGTEYEQGKYSYNGITDYLRYIKECPEIVKSCMTQRDDLVKLNNELLDIYNKQIEIMTNFVSLIVEGGTASDLASKEAVYDKLVALNSKNLKMYEMFNSWNNRLRE